MTKYHDNRRNAKHVEIDVGDKVLRPQKKTTVKTPFDPAPLTVIKKKGYMVTARTQQGKLVTRAGNKFKKVTARDPFFRNLSTTPTTYVESDSDDDFLFRFRQQKHADIPAPPVGDESQDDNETSSSESDTIPYGEDEEREVEENNQENEILGLKRRRRKAPRYLEDYEL